MRARRVILLAALVGSGTRFASPCALPAQAQPPTDPGRAAPGAAAVWAQALTADAPVPKEVAAHATMVLAARGFENVASVVDGSRLVVTFENVRYRDEVRALREAARAVLPVLESGQELVLVPANRGIPLVAVRFAGAGVTTADESPGRRVALVKPVAVSLNVSELPPDLRTASRMHRSFGKFQLLFHPWFEAQFGGSLNDRSVPPVMSRTGVAPELRTTLWHGFSLSASVLVTLQDNVTTGDSRIRPALVTANQTVRLPRNVFVSATLGTFTQDRYGADLEALAYLDNGRWTLGAELGQTGAASYGVNGWYRWPMRDRVALFDIGYRVARYDLILAATAGEFLSGDRGARFDFRRQFGEVEIGWFAVKSEAGGNGGVVLRIPLPPASRAALGPVWLGAAGAIPLEYRYHGLPSAGRRYRTGTALEEFGQRLNPTYIRTR